MAKLQWKSALFTVALTACDPAKGDADDNDDTTGTQPPGDTEGSSSGGDGQTSLDPTVDPTDPSDTTPEEESGTTCSFICEGETEEEGGAVCSTWDGGCPDGEKCMPWANDGGSSWNSARCSPLEPDPDRGGDACEVQGSGVSGIDSCDVDSMCWNVNEENVGTCVEFCRGTEANPVCDDPGTTCVIANDGVLNLCLPDCNPLLSECEEGQSCYPVNDSFACAPDSSGTLGLYGDACEFLNACDPGLFCANAEGVPGCNGSSGCCSNFCDLTEADPNAQCEGDGQECVAWYEKGQTPPGFDDVGACAIPQ